MCMNRSRYYRKYQLPMIAINTHTHQYGHAHPRNIVIAIIVDRKCDEMRREIRRRSRENGIAKEGEKGCVHYALRCRHKRGDRSSVKDM